jgi:hypothetical protein
MIQPGQRFGRLTIIGPDTSIGLQTPGGWWTAECDCGERLTAPAQAFTGGRVIRCGRPPAGTAAALAAAIAAQQPTARL